MLLKQICHFSIHIPECFHCLIKLLFQFAAYTSAFLKHRILLPQPCSGRLHQFHCTLHQKFHESIANATHNAFVKQFMPVIFNAIKKGVIVMTRDKDVSADNLNDDRLIMDFIKKRNAEGARTAMRLHILHAMEHL